MCRKMTAFRVFRRISGKFLQKSPAQNKKDTTVITFLCKFKAVCNMGETENSLASTTMDNVKNNSSFNKFSL